jgi:hypothetical protein
MRRVFFFEKVNYLSLLIGLIISIFAKKIYYRDSIPLLKKNNFFNKFILSKIFLQIGYKNIDTKYFNLSYFYKDKLLERFQNNFINKNALFDFIINYLNIKNNKKKLEITYKEHLNINSHLSLDTSSYILLKLLFSKKKVKIYYFSSSINSYLILKELKNKNFVFLRYYIFLNFLYYFFSNFFYYVFTNIFNKNNNKNIIHNNYNSSDEEIAYLPNRNLWYGDMFNKIFLYENDKNSALYKNKILTLFFEPTDKLTLRFLKMYKLSYEFLANFKFSLVSNFYLRFFFIFIKKNKSYFFQIRNIFFFYITSIIFIKIKMFDIYFKKKKLKYIFSLNDTEVSKSFLLAANLNNIKTISIQDRIITYLYTTPIFYNYYLIAGNAFLNILNKKNYIDEYKVLGLPRSSLINEEIYKKSRYNKELDVIKSNKKIILCLLNPLRNEWNVNLYGEDGNSLKSISDFLNDILKLSYLNDNCYFIVKFKIFNLSTDFFEMNKLNKIKTKNNIKIIYDNFPTSSHLASKADLIIGKHSTIMDEALLNKKKIILYDTENFVSSLPLYKNLNFMIVRNYLELRSKFLLLINNQDNDYNDKVKKYISSYLRKTDFKELNEFIKLYIKSDKVYKT